MMLQAQHAFASSRSAAAANNATLFLCRRCRCAPAPRARVATGSGSGANAAPGDDDEPSAAPPTPWSLTPYYTKKLERRTDALGNMLRGDDPTAAIAAPAGWTRERQMELALRAVAAELGAPEADVRARVELLRAVLPGDAFSSARPGDIVRLAMRADGVAANLLLLKEELPRADAARVAGGNAALLRMAPGELRAAVAEVGGSGGVCFRYGRVGGAAANGAPYLLHTPSMCLNKPLLHLQQTPQFKRLLLEEGGTDPDALAEVSREANIQRDRADAHSNTDRNGKFDACA